MFAPIICKLFQAIYLVKKNQAFLNISLCVFLRERERERKREREMELYSKEQQQGFFEELLGLREMEQYYSNHQDFFTTNTNNTYTCTNNIGWNILEDFSNSNSSSSFQDFSLPLDHTLLSPHHAFSSDNSSYTTNNNLNSQTLPYPITHPHPHHYYNSSSSFSLLDDAVFANDFDVIVSPPCKLETLPDLPAFDAAERKTKVMKKIAGQPSKNLMAERRRRKRLNDRLSMLRSVVPKISKMDRTSILGDTIDYMKELLHNINNLQEEMNLGENDLGLFKNSKPEEALIRNSPKFEVERRNSETRIEICCGGKGGLLLSTVTTLEALGIDIQHCVISCFNDFTMQASCSEDLKQRAVLDCEDIKQALFRNAGYGGRCL